MITSKDFMLCQSITENELSDLKQEDFKANIKFDGERLVAIIEKYHDTPLTPMQEDIIVSKSVILLNRRGSIINKNFKEVVKDLEAFSKTLKEGEVMILDGEIISIDDDFTKLQRRALTKDTNKIKALEKEVPVKYMIFDIMNRGDKNLMFEPLEVRINELQKIYAKTTQTTLNIELAEYGCISEMLAKAKAEKREGIVIKDLKGIYEGRRSKYWKKLKFFQEADITFTKYTTNNAGIRVETDDGKVACQVAGEQSQEVKDLLDKNKSVELTIQYLTKNEETGGYRFPSYRGIK